MGRWIVPRLGFAAMAAVAFVLAHDLVFLAGYGASYEQALAESGHDGAWRAAVLGVLAIGALLLVAGAWRLHVLGLDLRLVESSSQLGVLERTRARRARRFVRRLLPLWIRLTLATALWYVVQENLEHLQIGATLPGLGVLVAAAGHPSALPIIVGVALTVAFVGALFRWRHDALVARITAARARLRSSARPASRPAFDWIVRRRGLFLGQALAVRAPPHLAGR
jgi:hypothetical protein